jgi:hypothetical protein
MENSAKTYQERRAVEPHRFRNAVRYILDLARSTPQDLPKLANGRPIVIGAELNPQTKLHTDNIQPE